MDTAIVILSIIGALLIGTMSPGPSFLVVARISLAQSRHEAIAAALGVGLGGVVYGGLALLGLHLLLAQVEWLYLGLKILGGSYLMYLAYLLWKGAGDDLQLSSAHSKDGAKGKTAVRAPELHTPELRAPELRVPELRGSKSRGFGRALLVGMTTQLSNPKTAIVYSSIFAAFLPAAFPLSLSVVLLSLIFLVESSWYGLVAVTLSSSGPRGVYLRAKRWIDRLAGSVMGFLGVRLIADS
ncbi:LysE family translocator [Denitrobaculum tricleocarpae]|uniref:LysE family translocator n=1 Tax=Denitrobaculum tricleocarpae TaxID=2591009 RepID=A0A545TF53_9PROT|nr:LysE family translocator [Denitrobaculum tricleocarpae]TQV75811.1 LysE family translocator [Denitrobaculum tricleocarpae]